MKVSYENLFKMWCDMQGFSFTFHCSVYIWYRSEMSCRQNPPVRVGYRICHIVLTITSCFFKLELDHFFSLLLTAERVKNEKLNVVCIPTSFQVSPSFYQCHKLQHITPNLFGSCSFCFIQSVDVMKFPFILINYIL